MKIEMRFDKKTEYREFKYCYKHECYCSFEDDAHTLSLSTISSMLTFYSQEYEHMGSHPNMIRIIG